MVYVSAISCFDLKFVSLAAKLVTKSILLANSMKWTSMGFSSLPHSPLKLPSCVIGFLPEMANEWNHRYKQNYSPPICSPLTNIGNNASKILYIYVYMIVHYQVYISSNNV